MLTSKLKDEQLKEHARIPYDITKMPVSVTFNFISPFRQSTDSIFANSSQMNPFRLPQFLYESEQCSQKYAQTSKHFYQEDRDKNQQILDLYENFQEKLLSKYKGQEPKRKIYLFSREKKKRKNNRSSQKQNRKFMNVCTIKSIRLKNTHKSKDDEKGFTKKINTFRTPFRSPSQSKRGISLSTLTLKKSQKSIDSRYLYQTAEKKQKKIIYLTPRKKFRGFSSKKITLKERKSEEKRKPKLKILKMAKFPKQI